MRAVADVRPRPAARPQTRSGRLDIDVTPDGHGLPPGSGTAARARRLYAARCVTCHGATGKEGPQDVLVGGRGSLASPKPLKTVGSYWPYATTLWDYIHRAMPFDHPGTLTADEVYSTTAYVLFLNGIVGENDVLDQTTLPKVEDAEPQRLRRRSAAGHRQRTGAATGETATCEARRMKLFKADVAPWGKADANTFAGAARTKKARGRDHRDAGHRLSRRIRSRGPDELAYPYGTSVAVCDRRTDPRADVGRAGG